MLRVTMWVLQIESCVLKKAVSILTSDPLQHYQDKHTFSINMTCVVPSPHTGIIHIIQILTDITDSIII